MLLGLTYREAGLVAFIFALVWFAQLVPRVGAAIGESLGKKS
jgi:hypothetical protein